MTTPFEKLISGFFIPLRGLQMILSSPKLLILSIIPFLLGIGFVFIGFLFASQYLTPFFESWFKFESIEQYSQFLMQLISAVLMFVYWLAVAVFNFLFGYVCIIIFAGPFYALLTEATFKQLGVVKDTKGSMGLFIKMIFLGLIKVLLFLFIGLLCFFLTFVPLVNVISPFIIFAMVAYDCMDYAFEVDWLSLRRRFSFFKAHFYEFMGLTFAIFLTSLVPGSFFVLLPAFICGATKMYIQLAHKAV